MINNIICINHKGIMNEDSPIDYTNAPVITKEDYEQRISKLLELGADYTHLCIYADREHFSNLEYVTGYDPRYEECMLILQKGHLPRLLVGNEGVGQSECIKIDFEKVLFQSFSPMGQSRGRNKSLVEILKDSNINSKSKVGVLGWKFYGPNEFEDYKKTIEIPSYIVKALESLTDNVENANWLMMDNEKGLRTINDAKTLILSEIASTKASRKVWNFMKGLKEGITEIEASQLLNIDGEPCPTHPNISFAGKGILSPDYHRTLRMGAPIAFGMGYRYAQIHRVGLYARSEDDLDPKYHGCIEGMFKPYYKAVATWFENLQIGATGGKVWEEVKKVIGSYEDFGIVLNPGHLIHSDEWVNSPFYENSHVQLKSGMLIQCDFTARPKKYHRLGVHIEDGLMLADAKLREEIKELNPESYNRMIERQRFMREVLGINLPDEVLPTSDLCGMLHPFYADLDTIFAIVK